MPRKETPTRHWPFTWYPEEPAEEPPPDLLALTTYYCDAAEYGEEKKRFHHQGFLTFTTPRTFLGVKAIFKKVGWNDVHFERAYGTAYEGMVYCKGPYDKVVNGVRKVKAANPTFREWGVPPVDEPPAVAYRDRCANAIKKARTDKLDELAEEDPQIFLQYNRTLMSLRQYPVTTLNYESGVWIHGPVRTGKTMLAASYEQYGKVFKKLRSQYWTSYKGESVVVMEDVDPEWVRPVNVLSHLKVWCDRVPNSVELKLGTEIMIRPKLFIVTSNYKLDELVSGRLYDALNARFTQIEWTEVTRSTYKFDVTTQRYTDPPLPPGCTLGAPSVASAADTLAAPSAASDAAATD